MKITHPFLALKALKLKFLIIMPFIIRFSQPYSLIFMTLQLTIQFILKLIQMYSHIINFFFN